MKPQITDAGIEIQSFDEAFQELADGYREIYGQDISIDQEDPDGQRIGIEARANLDLQQLAVSVYNSLDPDFDDGLMRTAKLSGIYLKPASLSQWDLTVTASRSVTLKAGYTVKDDLDQEWRLTGDVDLTAGVNAVTFVAKDLGRVEGGLNSVISPVTIVLGVTSITADVAAIEGRDEETPSQLRQRRERSLQNPAYSVLGSMFAKLAGLDGVSDLAVYENDQSFEDPTTGLPPHSIWAIIEGGRVDDITETMVKQKTAGCYTVGGILSTWVENIIRPNGELFRMQHFIRFDRPTYVDVYVKVTVEAKTSGDAVDAELIKQAIASKVLSIGEPLQPGELYAEGYKAGDNFILISLQISKDGIDYTDNIIVPNANERLILSVDNIDI